VLAILLPKSQSAAAAAAVNQHAMERDGLIFRRRVLVAGVDYNGATRNQSMALDHIHDYYKKALRRLPPELIPSLLEAGFCFGFLDPVSNIIANTVSHELDKRRENIKKRLRSGNKKKGKRSESRRTAISKIITESSKNIRFVPRASDSSKPLLLNSSIAARSLRGLVTFLTSYFRYLTTWDALRYPCLSNADLLVAVHLIQEVRHTHTFNIQHPTAETAQRCAAIAALHPAVDTLVSVFFAGFPRRRGFQPPDTELHQPFRYRETLSVTHLHQGCDKPRGSESYAAGHCKAATQENEGHYKASTQENGNHSCWGWATNLSQDGASG
jgi:hypothetical protein